MQRCAKTANYTEPANQCVSFHHHSTKPYNATSFNEYVLEGSAPVLPETQRLFQKLISLGIKPVFLTGRTEDQRAITVANLRRQGYSGWEKLLLKPIGFKGTAIGYKSSARQKLQNAGYVIVAATSATSGATSSAHQRAHAPSSCPTPSTTLAKLGRHATQLRAA
jgi:hypothetical protein